MLLYSFLVTSLFFFGTSALVLPVNISGEWILVASYLEGYQVQQQNASFYTVKCNEGVCTAWKTANITILSSGLQIQFDSGLMHTGILATTYDEITWSDNSQWLLPPTETVKIHLCPHSHTDPGWLNTINNLFNDSVRQIYSEVTQALLLNPNRTYATEIVVFWTMFWNEQNSTYKNQLLNLVNNGQLVFTGGGYVQHDEAITRYEDQIDQMTLGHLWAQSAMGSPPITTAWQADPFGHSSTFAALVTDMVMDGFTFGRPMSQGDDPINMQSGVIWHPSMSFPDPGIFDSHAVLTRAQTIGYWEPYRSMHGSLYDGNATEAAIILQGFIDQMIVQRPSISNVMIMCGDDFQLFDALTVFPTLDRTLQIINTMNNSQQLNVIYSTPPKYYAALAAEQAHKRKYANVIASHGSSLSNRTTPDELSTVSPAIFPSRPWWDMMPLIGCEFPSPWTGFYLSRPEFKNLFHYASGFRRSMNTLHSLARDDNTWETGFNQLLTLWEAISLAQHHDAITGDSYDNVMEDFKMYIDYGLGNASATGQSALGIVGGPANTFACINVSSVPCPSIVNALSAGQSTTVTIFNPVGWNRNEYIEIMVPITTIAVTEVTNNNNIIVSQITSAIDTDYDNSNMYVLSFLAANLPPLGYRTYTLTSVAPNAPGSAYVSDPVAISSSASISSGNLTLQFASNGTLTSITNNDEGVSIIANAEILYYSSDGGVENAWDFATQGNGPTSAASFPGSNNPTATYTSGPLFQEIRQVLDSTQRVSIRYRIYQNENFIRVYSGTGPFINTQNRSMDAIYRITTNLNNNSTFISDSNGLELLPRVLNGRPWWNGQYIDSKDPVSSNYYPITSGIYMSDITTGSTLGFLPSLVSHGCSSMLNGELECMVGRAVRTNQGNLTTGNRHVTVLDILTVSSSSQTATSYGRPLMSLLANPVSVFAQASSSVSSPHTNKMSINPGLRATVTSTAPFSPLGTALPPNVELLTLQTLPPNMNVSGAVQGLSSFSSPSSSSISPPLVTPVSQTVVLLRLHHIYAIGEDEYLAQSVDIDIGALFAPRWTINGVTEMTLTATRTMAVARAEQIQWEQLSSSSSSSSSSSTGPAIVMENSKISSSSVSISSSPYIVTLRPMEIKTYVLSIA